MARMKLIAEALLSARNMFPHDFTGIDVKRLASDWAMLFKDVPDEEFSTAYAACLRRAKFAPKPGDVQDVIDRRKAASRNDAAEWDDVLRLCRRLVELQEYFRYTYIPEGETRTQGETARIEAQRAFREAPEHVRRYLGTYSAALQYATETDRLDATGLSIRRNDYIKARRAAADYELELLPESPSDEVYTRGVIGYNGYTPVLEDGA